MEVKKTIENETVDKIDTDLKCFLKIFIELSIMKDLIVKWNCIYIPSSLRKKILNAAHESH